MKPHHLASFRAQLILSTAPHSISWIHLTLFSPLGQGLARGSFFSITHQKPLCNFSSTLYVPRVWNYVSLNNVFWPQSVFRILSSEIFLAMSVPMWNWKNTVGIIMESDTEDIINEYVQDIGHNTTILWIGGTILYQLHVSATILVIIRLYSQPLKVTTQC